MKNVLMTCCDSKYGDFLVDHFLRSLTETSCTTTAAERFDIIILDYGLTPQQKKSAQQLGAKVVACKRDGPLTNIRFRDYGKIISKGSYEQVLLTDCGDLFFQKDISEIFLRNPTSIRIVEEELMTPYMYFMRPAKSSVEHNRLLKEHSAEKLLNAGVICAPASLFLKLLDLISAHIEQNKFGLDQTAINLYVRSLPHVVLSSSYNFVLVSATSFTVKEGKIYDSRDSLVHVVHNVGRYDWARSLSEFGYLRCRGKTVSYYMLHCIYIAYNLVWSAFVARDTRVR